MISTSEDKSRWGFYSSPLPGVNNAVLFLFPKGLRNYYFEVYVYYGLYYGLYIGLKITGLSF